LTFQNSKCLTDAEIRSVFEPAGGVLECDGAVSGPSEGWVMVSMRSQEIANSAVRMFKELNNSIGESLRPLDSKSENGGPARRSSESKDNRSGSNEASDKANDIVKIVKKKTAIVSDSDKFQDPDTFGGTTALLSTSHFSDLGGMKQFTQTNSKILELVSHNNLLLIEKIKDNTDDCTRQVKEKDDQIRRLQNLLNNQEENCRNLTNRLNANQEFENKVKKFFGENEDYHKKRVGELTKQNQELVQRLEESEKARMDKVLEENDSSKVRGEVEKLAHITDSILSKTEQVFAVVQGLDIGGVVKLDGKGDGKVDPMAGSTAALLHNKVDKAIRILAETSENQRKMNKVLQDLIKFNGIIKSEQDTEVEEKKPKKKKDKDKERDRSRGRKRSRSRSAEKRRRSRSGSGDRVMIKQVMPPAAIDVEYEEMKWALNMTLIGDMHWKSLTSVDDIKSIVLRMDRKVNFKVICNDDETLATIYDGDRDTLMVPLPKPCFKVGISIGTYDLSDPGLITLKDAPMDEVMKRNEPKLKRKASLLRELVLNLVRQNKQVIVMIPPHGEERVEVHKAWEDIVLSYLKDIRFPSIRILNMAQTMRNSMGEFEDNKEYLDMWLKPYPKPRRYLSAYGIRRMFYALRKTVNSRTPQQAGMDNWPTPQSHPAPKPSFLPPPVHHSAPTMKAAPVHNPAIVQPRIEDFPCPRCTRTGHTQDVCKSLDKGCRICGNVGHLTSVHDVMDERFRQVITRVLGVNLWEDTKPPQGYGGTISDDNYEPELKRGRLDQGPQKRIPLEKLAEMEQRGQWGGSRQQYY